MRKSVFISALILVITCIFTSCNASGGESFGSSIVLDNGVTISVLSDYNQSGLTLKGEALPGWFGGKDDTDNMKTKIAEMEEIEAVYMPSLAADAEGFSITDTQIGWCWGNPSDSIKDLSLTRVSADSTYILDINYDMRNDINDSIKSDDSRDIMRFLLSFVTNDPSALEDRIYRDCFASGESLSSEDDWLTVADCEIQWNASTGYGISFVIRQHADSTNG